MRSNKKGVSPLIATVLLIAFAVALGAVVMNWGRTYVEQTADKAQKTSDRKVSCSMDVGMKFVTLNGEKQVCYNTTDNIIKFTVANIGSKRIESISVQVIGSTDFFVASLLNSSINPSYPFKSNVSYIFETYGAIQKVSLIPAIKVEGELNPVPCSDNALSEEELSTC